MGYNTVFKGVLKFTSEMKASDLATLNEILGEDCRDHPEWMAGDLSYVDLVITKDFSGLAWNDQTEKTYSLEKLVNLVIRLMLRTKADFGLSGQLEAQGEDIGDRWLLVVENGLAKKKMLKIKGKRITCPECEHEFILEEKQ